MIGKYTEKEFEFENYEEFYEHHHFQPIAEEDCTNVHELIPRFSWGFDKVKENGGKTLLDLGCLEGSFVLSVAKHLGLSVTGVDLTKDGIELAKARATRLKLDAQFYQGFAEEWLEQFAKEGKKFDVVSFMEIIEHVEDPDRFIKLIDNVLAPGGYVILSTPSFESPAFGMDDEANKCHIRLYTTKPENYMAVNKYGHEREATSMIKQIGKDRIKEMEIYSELIHVLYR